MIEGDEIVRVLGALLVLIALAMVAIRLGGNARNGGPLPWQGTEKSGKGAVPKWWQSVGSGPIRLLGWRNLAPGVGLRLVQVGSRTWLIGVTREQISLLAELAANDFGPSEESGS